MNRTLKIVFVFILISQMGFSQKTFTGEVANIIFNNCTVCHRPGEIGPFSLTSYDEVVAKANSIKYVTETKFMPPWKADPAYSHFLGETVLTAEDITTIAEWVDNGTPYGDPSEVPPLPQFPEGSLLGEPDLVLAFSEAHLHPGNNKDEYRYFVIPTGLTEDKVLKAIELRPGNTKIVHHALFFEDKSGKAKRADEATSEYGFDAFDNTSGFGIAEVLFNNQYPGYVPGQKPRFYPDGLGQKLTAGVDLVVQMHYAPWPIDEFDKSTINLFFADENEKVDRFVEDHVMVPLPGVLINGPFILNAGTKKSFHGIWPLPKDVSFIGISPHMHLLGTDWEVYLEDREGNRTNMISIPDWDFNWQGMYYFPKMIVGKQGWRIHAIASYDNTTDNPFNPNNPPRFVTWGEGTEDEMYYLPLLYTDYQEGDENIVFDSTLIDEIDFDFSGDKIFQVRNNLSSEGNSLMPVGFYLSQGKMINLSIYDIQGRHVRTVRKNEFFNKGSHIVNIDSENLPTGTYIVNLRGNDLNLSERFIKIN